MTVETLSSDLLIGAEAICQYIYGASDRKTLRRAYYYFDRGHLPVFHIGRTLAARKSELDAALRAGTAPVEGAAA